jgi:hypothetical protein
VVGLGSLAGAFAVVAVDPAGVAGFFYQPRMLAVVHLVTLGWIGGSVLGSIHIVGPLALRMPLRATVGDLLGFAAFAVGMLGMVSHFWLATPSGMAWSAGLASLAFLRASARVLPRLARASVPTAVKVPIGLAFVNVLIAAALGVLLGVNKLAPFLPVSHLQAVLAHAHLAALGFGTLMVMGAGYRLLPMILPAAMTRGRGPLASALLVEAGVLGLAASFFRDGRGRALFALVSAAGVFLFLAHVIAMLRDPRPAPPERPRPDVPRAQGAVCPGLSRARDTGGSSAGLRSGPGTSRARSAWRTARSRSSASWRRWSSPCSSACCRSRPGSGRSRAPVTGAAAVAARRAGPRFSGARLCRLDARRAAARLEPRARLAPGPARCRHPAAGGDAGARRGAGPHATPASRRWTQGRRECVYSHQGLMRAFGGPPKARQGDAQRSRPPDRRASDRGLRVRGAGRRDPPLQPARGGAVGA